MAEPANDTITADYGRMETRIRTMSAQIAALTARVDNLSDALINALEEIDRLNAEKGGDHAGRGTNAGR